MHILRSENIRYTLFIPDLGNYPDHNRTSTSVTLLFSQFYWQRFAKKTMQYVTEVWEMLRKEQRTQKVGGRGEP